MATRAEYKAQGYTDAQINAQIAKNPVVSKSSGPNAPITAPVAPTSPNLVPLTAVNSAPVSPDIAPAMREGTTANPVQTPAPVAPTAPAVTQAPPVSPDIAPSQREGTTSVPVAPVQSPTVAQAKPETVKTAATVATAEKPQSFYDSSAGREQDILRNLTQFYTEWATDLATIRQMAGYATADQNKKNLIDAFYQSKQPKTEDQFLSVLLSGGQVMNRDSLRLPEYAKAQARFEVASQWKGASTDTLYNSMVSGKLSPESSAYKDLLKMNGGETPEMVEAKRKYETKRKIDSINRTSEILGGTASGKAYSETPSRTQAISDELVASRGMDYATEFKKAVSENPEIVKLSSDLSATTLEIKDLEDQKARTMKDIAKQYKGITTGSAMLLANQQNEAINERLNQLYNKQSVQTANLNYNTSLAEKAFDYKVKQDETDRAAALQIAQEERQFARQKELSQFQSDLSISAKQKEFEQQLAQKAAIAKDPVLATQDVIEQYRKLGVFAQRSDAEIVADIEAQVANGKPLGEALSELNKAFQSKPEYKRSIEIKQGELSDREKFALQESSQARQEAASFARQKELAKFNKDLAREQFLFEIENDPEKRAKVAAMEQALSSDASLLSLLGKNVATYAGNRGHDLAGKIGDPLPAGWDWEVVSIIDANYASSPYGNSVLMKDEDGNTVRYSHLDSIGVKQGDKLSFGTIVGTRGNTGNVKGANGETLTKAQLAAGRGAHVDVEIKDKSGRLISENEQKAYLASRKSSITKELGPADFEAYNSLTPSEKTKKQSDQSYRKFSEKKESVMSDPNASIYDVMNYTRGGKDMGEERLKSLGKFGQALSQVSELQKALKKESTGPIVGTLREYNPYDSSAQALKARLNSLVPNIARGVYGEVGVLTDADIELYKKTLPNIRSTEDTNKLVLAMTLSAMINGFKTQIQIDWAGGRDVSGFAGTVKRYENEVGSLLNTIGGNQNQSSKVVPQSFKDLYNNL